MAITGPEIAGPTVSPSSSSTVEVRTSSLSASVADLSLSPQEAAAIAVQPVEEAAQTPVDTDPAEDDPLASAAATIEELVGGFTGEGELEILLDEEADRFIYQSVDPETGEVLRQFPPEEILQLVRAIRDMEGLVIDETA